MPDRSQPEPYEDVILEEARRAINTQVSALDELRARTGVLLAATAVSGSFLGAATADKGVSLSFWGGAAVVAFVLGVFSCIVVLWPPRDDAWTFVNGPKQLIEDWIKVDQEGQTLHVSLAGCLEDHCDKNEKRLLRLYKWFLAAAVSVGSSEYLDASRRIESILGRDGQTAEDLPPRRVSRGGRRRRSRGRAGRS